MDPTPTANANGTPVVDPTPMASSIFGDPTPTAIVASDPVPNTDPFSYTSAIAGELYDLGFDLSSAGGRRSVDEKIGVLFIGPLCRVAACFGVPPNPNGHDLVSVFEL